MKMFRVIPIFFLLFFSISCNSQKADFAKSSDSASIYFRTYGSGAPLLIINGGPGMNSNGFENLAVRLSQNNQCIIYDQRGTGKSVLPRLDSSTVNMKLMIDDIESIRQQLKIEKWAVLGHSFGGILASYYATLYPEHIDRIILSSSGGIDLDILNYAGSSINGKLSPLELDSFNYWTKKINEGDTSYEARIDRGRALAPAYLFNKKYVPVIAERLTQGNSTVGQLLWGDLQKINFDCAPQLKSFAKPVLIIQGKEDIVKKETAEKSHKAFQNSRIVYMEHCGHYGWLDNESVYFGEIAKFLKS